MSGAAIYVRALTSDDWQKASLVRLEALQNYPEVFLSKYEDEKQRTPDQWRELICQDGGCFFGLYNSQLLIGIIGVITWRDAPGGATGAVVAHYIQPDYRKQGLSKPMYRACLDWALSYTTWEKLIVTHRAGNEASRRAILGSGFQFSHNETIDWPDGAVADECVYEIDLQQLRQKQ